MDTHRLEDGKQERRPVQVQIQAAAEGQGR
jgi:hypothetical protein